MKTIIKLKFVFITFCIIGCILQLYSITNIYLSYPTTTMVNVEYPESFILPAVTFCTGTNYLKTNITGTTAKEALNSGKNILELVFYCSVVGIDCSIYTNNITTTNYNYMCLTFNYHNYSEYFTPKYVNYSMIGFSGRTEIITIFFNMYNNNDLYFYIHSNDMIPLGNTEHTHAFIINRNELKRVTYKKITAYYLPKPYETNCINYSTIGFNSFNDCFTKCAINLSLTK